MNRSLAIVLLGILFCAPQSWASTLTPPLSNLALFCGTGIGVVTPGVAARDCEAVLDGESLSASAETLQSLYAGSSASISGGSSLANGRAELLFEFAVTGGADAPFQPAGIPVLLTVDASVDTLGDTFHDVVGVANQGLQSLLMVQLLGDTGGSTTESASIELGIDEAVDVVLATLCQANGGLTPSACAAALQFGLVLDQAAFDAAYGAMSFTLVDYYALEVSEGLTVPLPGAFGLLLLALAAMGAVAKRPGFA